MVWSKISKDGLLLSLTDGYCQKQAAARRIDNHSTAEQHLARRLYDCGKGSHLSPVQRSRRPERVDVWILGKQDWIKQAPEPFHSLSDREQDPTYRIIVIGERLNQFDGVYYHNWPSWIKRAGITKKKHGDLANFRELGAIVLGWFSDSYEVKCDAHSEVLRSAKVPSMYYGDSWSNLEGSESTRIQQ